MESIDGPADRHNAAGPDILTSRSSAGSSKRVGSTDPARTSLVGQRLTEAHPETRLLAAGVIVVAAAVVGIFQMNWGSLVGLWGPIFVTVAAVWITVRVVRTTAALSDLSNMARILWLGLVVKGIGTLARYLVVSEVYGSGDEQMYYDTGELVAQSIREGVWSLQGTPIEPHSAGTQSIGWIAGTLFSVVGANRVLGYAFFSWLSWLGLVMFYRAFRVVAPKITSKYFALCLFFLPSLTYWPSSIGKEAFMTCMLGLATLGVARITAGQQYMRSMVFAGVGAAGLSWVRPHMAIILMGAAVVGLMVRRPGSGRAQSRILRGAILVLMIPAMFLGLSRVERMFGEYSGNWVEAGVTQTQGRSTQGGSSFRAESVRSPVDFPAAAVSVTFRPLPWQAQGGTALVASLESLLLLGLAVWNWRALVRWLRLIPKNPAVAFCTAYIVLFVIAFSNVGNAGILARQRTQMLPYLLMAVCIAADSLKTPPKPAVSYERDAFGWSVTTKIPDASTVLDARPS